MQYLHCLFHRKRLIYSLEVKFLEGEMRLYDTSGLDSCPKNILLCRDVTRRWQPIQGIQVTEKYEYKHKT